MNIRKLEDLSKEELIELIKHEREVCDQLKHEACGQLKPISEATGQPVNGFCDPGMTLRDYFAARMMTRELSQEMRPHQDYNYHNAAIRSYRMADAMLEARENKS